MKVLFVSANFSDEYMDIEREQRTLQRLFDATEHDLQVLPAAEIDDLREALTKNKHCIDVLHFSGHATAHEGLQFRGEGRQKSMLSVESLKRILAGAGIRLVVLNACQSVALAKSLADVVPAAIGTTRVVRDVVARRFTRHFYTALKNDATVEEALTAALQVQKPSASPAYVHIEGICSHTEVSPRL